jgi:uncharacterized membrane protein HdeD (DUF308 family)
MKLKITSVILGLILLIAGIVLVITQPNGPIAYPISLIGIGGYLFAVGLASMLMNKLFYKDTAEASAPRNKLMRILEVVVYSFMGIVVGITIILCFTVLK